MLTTTEFSTSIIHHREAASNSYQGNSIAKYEDLIKQPSEPILIPKLRIYLADFPYLL